MAVAPLRILMVDDDKDDLSLTRNLLSDMVVGDFELRWLADPDVALEEICSREPDLPLIDYQQGFANVQSLLRDTIERGCKVPVILLTTQGDAPIDLG